MRTSTDNKCVAAIRKLLNDAHLNFEVIIQQDSGRVVDFMVRIPGIESTLSVNCHSALAPNQVKQVITYINNANARDSHLALCVPKLTWSLLDKCRELEVAVFDHEGNAYVNLPGLYIERLRPSRSPGIEPSSGTVFTAKAGRLLRALFKRYPHDSVRANLARETELTPGYVSILIARLIKQEYVSDRMGLIYLDDPEKLLDDWLAHYRFDRHQKYFCALSANTYEQGIEKLGKNLSDAGVRYAWTGWTGAQLRAPYATPTQYMAYVSHPPENLEGVFPVEGQGNVVLLVPQDEGVFQFTTSTNLGDVVSDPQLYIDLCRMPGRAQEQADALRNRCLNFARMVR